MTKLIYYIKISKLDGVSLSLTLPGQGQCVALVKIHHYMVYLIVIVIILMSLLRYTITWCILLWLSLFLCPYYYSRSSSRRDEFSRKPEKLPGRSFQNFSMLWGIPGRIADRTLTLTFTMTLKWQASKVKKITLVISTFLFWKAWYLHENFTKCAKYHDTSFVFYT